METMSALLILKTSSQAKLTERIGLEVPFLLYLAFYGQQE